MWVVVVRVSAAAAGLALAMLPALTRPPPTALAMTCLSKAAPILKLPVLATLGGVGCQGRRDCNVLSWNLAPM
jgi:hypothetical protein